MTESNDTAEPSGASGGSHWLAILIDAVRLYTVLAILFSSQVRCNPNNFRTHWPLAWVNVNGVTQIEVYVSPSDIVNVRLNWIE